MAEDDDIDDNEEGEEKTGGKKGLIIIIVVVLLLIGGGAGAYFAGLFGGDESGDAHVEAGHGEEAHDTGHGGGHGEAPAVDEHGNPIGPVFYELPEFLVNLNTDGKRTSFLKMKVTLELEGQDAVLAIDQMKPKLMDAFNTYLRELRTSDLSGSAGIYRLRQELLMRTNKTLHPHQVKDILFSEIIVQ